jgi:hypothetical protein
LMACLGALTTLTSLKVCSHHAGVHLRWEATAMHHHHPPCSPGI